MKRKLFSGILSIFILIVISCDKDKSLTTTDEINFPKQLTSSDNARLPKWIPNNNLLLITSVQTTDSTSYWTDCFVVDLEGNVIRKILKTSSKDINFSPNGEHYICSRDGNLWIDKM